MTPHVVYHVAGMGADNQWQPIVREQLRLLRDVRLTTVRVTHVGEGRDWLIAEAAVCGLDLTVVRSDPNVLHYETFAMLEIERLAKETDIPILYLHTKGASNAWHHGKQQWRRVMEDYVVRRWRENITHLADGAGYDAIGFNWHQHGEQHFSGNFWIARPDWIRRLPDFAWYHGRKGLTRYSCEMWIGAQAHPTCRAYSLACTNQPTWTDDFNFAAVMPPPVSGMRLNLGCGPIYRRWWSNVDLNPDVQADIREDAVTLPSFISCSVDEIFAGHLLEHVADVDAALRRWFNVLKPGGILTVAVPDCEGAVRLWRSGAEFPVMGATGDEGLFGIVTGYRSRPEAEADPHGLQAHRRVFDRSLLIGCLRSAGFAGVREVDGHTIMYAPCSRLGWQIAAEGTKPATESEVADEPIRR